MCKNVRFILVELIFIHHRHTCTLNLLLFIFRLQKQMVMKRLVVIKCSPHNLEPPSLPARWQHSQHRVTANHKTGTLWRHLWINMVRYWIQCRVVWCVEGLISLKTVSFITQLTSSKTINKISTVRLQCLHPYHPRFSWLPFRHMVCLCSRWST